MSKKGLYRSFLKALFWKTPVYHLTILLFFFICSGAYELSSVKFCKRELRMGIHSAVDCSSFIREICAMLGGGAKLSKLTKVYFRVKKITLAGFTQNNGFLGVIAASLGKFFYSFLYAVPDRSSTTLIHIIRQSIRPGTLSCSDES